MSEEKIVDFAVNSIRVSGSGKHSIFKNCVVSGERIVAVPPITGELGKRDMERIASTLNAMQGIADPKAWVEAVSEAEAILNHIGEEMSHFYSEGEVRCGCSLDARANRIRKQLQAARLGK